MELDWRLLHWLLRYPLQRADDLLVGVARWASRATVYRYLQGLEASGLVEGVVEDRLLRFQERGGGCPPKLDPAAPGIGAQTERVHVRSGFPAECIAHWTRP